MSALFFELFSGLPRQGPGDAASTLRALSLVPGIGPQTRVLDLGCGTGLHTRVLAQACRARILAIDNHAPFVEALGREARSMGWADRLEARVGDMRKLDLAPGSFDLVWSEGAIYVVGFAAGLRDWKRLLAPGGHLAVTEVCWRRADPAPECAAFWAQEYPAIEDVPTRLATVKDCGYALVGHFPLPPAAWWDDYYRPLLGSLERFRERHGGEPEATALADQVQREIDVWRAHSNDYGYEFFVMQAQ